VLLLQTRTVLPARRLLPKLSSGSDILDFIMNGFQISVFPLIQNANLLQPNEKNNTRFAH
jgi:hypothetical protein